MGVYNKNEISPLNIYKYNSDRDIDSKKLIVTIKEFLNSNNKETNEEIDIEGIAFSSVVPEVNNHYKALSKKFSCREVLEINNKTELGITLNYDDPEELGADRITNAVAAIKEYKEDSIIIDLGTAITFCVALKKGVFDGGLIAPGVGIAIKALSTEASRLINVDFSDPGNIIARNTEGALKSGFFYGWISMIDGIIDRIEREYQKKFRIILTGGYSDIIKENLNRKCILDPLLTMKGLKLIYDLNFKPK